MLIVYRHIACCAAAIRRAAVAIAPEWIFLLRDNTGCEWHEGMGNGKQRDAMHRPWCRETHESS